MKRVENLPKNTTKAMVRRDLDIYNVTGLDLSSNEEVSIDPCHMYSCVQADFELDDEGRNLLLIYGRNIVLVNSIDFDFF